MHCPDDLRMGAPPLRAEMLQKRRKAEEMVA